MFGTSTTVPLIGGDADSVMNDFNFIKTKFAAIGLQLNCDKCELYVHNTANQTQIEQDFTAVSPGIKIQSRESLQLLGAPVFDEAIPGFVEKNNRIFNDNSERLLEIHSHMAIHILRFCLFVPKFTYVMRSCPF